MRFLLVAGLLAVAAPVSAQTSSEVLGARAAIGEGRYADALATIRPAAEAGDPLAQSLLGLSYYYGDEGIVDAKLAVEWLTRASDQNYGPGVSDLGWIYRYGMEGLQPDHVRAREQFERAAKLGNARAGAELAGMLLDGLGGPADVDRAILLLRWAADSGDAMATELLGNELYYGNNIPVDEYEARRLFTIAAAQNFYVAQSNLGYMALHGQGGAVDLVLAQDVLGRAVANGYGVAGSNMAELLDAHPELAADPLDAAAYCIWSTDFAQTPAIKRDDLGCLPILQGLSPVQRKQARQTAEYLGPS
jgi:TPR repeat protein